MIVRHILFSYCFLFLQAANSSGASVLNINQPVVNQSFSNALKQLAAHNTTTAVKSPQNRVITIVSVDIYVCTASVLQNFKWNFAKVVHITVYILA